MEFFWYPEAVAEADAAADFYHNKQRELARRFINHLDETLDRIAIKPEIYREVEPGIRKIKLKTFPFAVIYRIKDAKIEIIAVMHIRRHPGYWKDRA
jgi:plasmid stabilization system protein ParE